MIAKRLGLSFEELNQMRMQDLWDFIDIWTGDTDDDDEPVEATQEDINKFFSM